jgi:hypothetical protein
MELEALKRQLQEVNNKVTTVITLLSGNDLDKENGLIHTVKLMQKDLDKQDDRIAKLEKWKDRFFWMMIGMAMPAGYGVSQLFGMIFKN